MPLTVDGSADRIPTSADELQVSPPLQARLCNRRPRAYRPRRAQPLSQGLLMFRRAPAHLGPALLRKWTGMAYGGRGVLETCVTSPHPPGRRQGLLLSGARTNGGP